MLKTNKMNIKIFLFNIKNNKVLKLLTNITLIFIILYPSNLLFNNSLSFTTIETPFFKYLSIYEGMLNLPVSFFLLFIFSFLFIRKKLYLNTDFLYLSLFVSLFLIYLVVTFFYLEIVDIRNLKNILQSCLFIFFLVCFKNFDYINKYSLYKYYNLILIFLCLLNLLNLSLYFNSGEDSKFSYFIPLGYFSGYFKYIISHYLDYFPYLIYLSCATDIFYFKKNKLLTSFFIFIKLIWYLTTNYYAINFDYDLINKGILMSILFFLGFSFVIQKNLFILNKFKIFLSIVTINLIYFLALILFYDFLEISLKDRAEAFFYLHDMINYKNLLFPFIVKYSFQHNLHNDFWDLYFTYGIFSLIFYLFVSKILNEIYLSNKLSFLLIFSIFCIGSLVQNNLLNIYLIINFSFVVMLLTNNKSNNI